MAKEHATTAYDCVKCGFDEVKPIRCEFICREGLYGLKAYVEIVTKTYHVQCRVPCGDCG